MNQSKITPFKIAIIYIVIFLHSCNPSANNSQDPNGGGLLTNLFLTTMGLEFKNQAVTTITGILYEPTGEPLANARLDLIFTTTREESQASPKIASETTTTSDSDGVFFLKLKLGSFSISVTKSDGTKMGSITMNVTDTVTPPKVGTASNFGMTGMGIAPVASKPPSVSELKLESLTYSASSFTLGLGIASTYPAKLLGGKSTSCLASPSLPTGLFLSSTSCRITGIPTSIQSATSYTITASNPKGSVTASLNLRVVVIPPSNLSYGVSSKVFSLNGANQSITPTYTGSPLTGCTITPSLPTGLSINTSNCAISGTPTVLTSQANYQITASNSAGSASTNLLLSVLAVPPTGISYGATSFIYYRNVTLTTMTPSFGGSPLTGCTINPSLPTGMSFNTTNCAISGTPSVIQNSTAYLITATNSAGSGTVTINISVEGAPSGLSYSTSSLTIAVGTAMTTFSPTVTGTVTSYTISPALPSGLSLNSSTGAINGTPSSTISSTSYTITATNPAGNTTFSLALSIVGSPSGLSYSNTNLILTTGTAMTNLTPTVTGTVTSYTVSPSLPNGLSLNNTTGVISGTPTTRQPIASYTIRANNIAGFVNSTISITIFLSPYVSMPTGLLKTGQTIVYQTGDDGTYQKGVDRLFVIGGTTGLLWQRCSAGQNADDACSGTAYTLNVYDADTYCKSLSIGGKTWRLPTISELSSLIEYGKSTRPLIDTTAFPNTQSDTYWSSSSITGLYSPSYWYASFSDGRSIADGGSMSLYVRCVTGQ